MVTFPRATLLITTVMAVAGGCGENGADAARSAPVTARVADPISLIGSDASTPGHSLHRVRGAYRTRDGRIVVGNSGSGQIRVFDADASLLEEMGGIGAGPEEFQSLQAIHPFRGDSILAWDPLLQRISIWSASGSVGRMESLRLARSPHLVGRLGEGRLLLAVERPLRASVTAAWTVWHDSLELLVWAMDRASDPRPLGAFPHTKKVAAETPSGRLIGAPMPESQGAVVAGRGNRIFIGLPDSGHVRILDGAGNPIDGVKLGVPARARSEAGVNAWLEEVMSDVPVTQRREVRNYYSQYPQPAEYPVFDALVVDQLQRLWARLYVAPGDSIAELVRVTENGEIAAVVRIPTGFTPTQIGADWVLGVLRGANDEEMVAVFPFAAEERLARMADGED